MPSTAAALNDSCFCLTLDRAKLLSALAGSTSARLPWDRLATTHPHLFASVPSFVSHADMDAMTRIVQTIERVAALPGYRDHVLTTAPDIALIDHGQRGVFMGYDFHVTPHGPQLIEINTNAGGAFLNAVLREAQRACCSEIEQWLKSPPGMSFTERTMAMFRAEWQHQFPDRKLRAIAIVDDDPSAQYLYPEFLLAQALFEAAGLTALICDPSELGFDGERLTANGSPIDLVYNRHVDFMLESDRLRALRQAYVQGVIVLTPNPHHHALLANKSNLAVLSDPQLLKTLGATDLDIDILRGIPATRIVGSANADELWATRKSRFFKPLSGHGGKAVYRGDKITTATWNRIRHEDYVAQEFVPPGTRRVDASEGPAERKMDVRLYTYAGDTLLAAARIYQGQTTNFRTPGGGFSPLYVV